jgi:anti-anti-sigma factor
LTASDVLRVEARRDGDPVILVLRGEFDHSTAQDVRWAVMAAVRDGYQDVVIDLSALSYMDGGGLTLSRPRSSSSVCWPMR